MKVLMTGGGTGGHVFPAIAIANAIKAAMPDTEFLFVGANGKMEMDKVPQAGYKIEGLTIAGIQRSFDMMSILKNLIFPIKLVMSMCKALWIVARFRPNVAVGTGGYASGPVLKICGWMGIPYFLQEQNSHAGITNKLLGLQSAGVFVAFEGMEKYFPKDKIHITGNPVRDSIRQMHMSRADAAKAFGLDANKKIVFVTGGSLGARSINQAIAEHIEEIKSAGIQLIWQCGKAYIREYRNLETAEIRICDFITNMEAAYCAADIIVSRSGGTISELAIIGKPTILLPSPNVAEDHQTKNVQALVDKQATILVKDIEAKDKLVSSMIQLLGDEAAQRNLSAHIAQFAKPNAAEEIAKRIIETINTER